MAPAVLREFEHRPLQARPRLSEVLIQEHSHGFDTLAALPSNIRAIETSLLFSSGIQTLGALVGPSGWGKTHLLLAAAERIGGFRKCPGVVNAEEWLARGKPSDPSEPLLLDNVQDILLRKRLIVPLRLELERRTRTKRPTLLSFTAPKLTRQIKALLPMSRDWVVATLSEPAACERFLIVRQMAAVEGLILSDTLTSILSRRLKGNGRTIQGALKRLRLSHATWVGDHRTLEACGVLGPFFEEGSAWDLRDHIVETAERAESSCCKQGLIAHTMLRVALLPEAEVAGYLQIEQSEAYGRALRFGKQRGGCELTARETEHFVREVVRGL